MHDRNFSVTYSMSNRLKAQAIRDLQYESLIFENSFKLLRGSVRGSIVESVRGSVGGSVLC